MPELNIHESSDYKVEQGIILFTPWGAEGDVFPVNITPERLLASVKHLRFGIRLTFELTGDDIADHLDLTDEEEDWLDEFEDDCDSLLSDLDIQHEFKEDTPDGVVYELNGTGWNLIAFMQRYTDHFGPDGFADDGSAGEALNDERVEFENFLDLLAHGQTNIQNDSFNHITIYEPENYRCTLAAKLIDPDNDTFANHSLKELKDWFIADYDYLRVSLVIPNNGIDDDDFRYYHSDLNEEEAAILTDWYHQLNDYRYNESGLDIDWEDNLDDGTLIEIGGSPTNMIRFFEFYDNPVIRDLPRHPLRDCIIQLKSWINKLFPVKKLGFFGESLEDGNPSEEEITNILKNHSDEEASKILFDRDLRYVLSLNSYVMLLNNIRQAHDDWESEIKRYREYVDIYPGLITFLKNSDDDILASTCNELQRLNVRDYSWSVLYWRTVAEPYTLYTSCQNYRRPRDWWKTIHDQIEYFEDKGIGRKPRRLGFFDK